MARITHLTNSPVTLNQEVTKYTLEGQAIPPKRYVE
jgi:hypothetical protein